MDTSVDNAATPALIVAVQQDELRKLIEEAFSFNAPDLQIIDAPDAASAFERAQVGSIDGVLVDVPLDDSRGTLDILQRFQRERPDILTLAIAEGKNNDLHEACFEVGVALYFERPVPLGMVAEKARTLLKAKTISYRGNLEQLSLPEILQTLCEHVPDVQLRFISDQGTGSVAVRQGKIVHAQTKDRRGEDAFYDICLWRGGSFEIVHVLRNDDPTIEKPRSEVLVTADRILHELPPKKSITGWYSVSGFHPRRRDAQDVREPAAAPKLAPSRSIAEITAEQEQQGAQVVGVQEPKPRKVETDIDGPIMPAYLTPERQKQKSRRAPRIVQAIAYIIILMLFSWTVWEWWLTQKATTSYESAEKAPPAKKATKMQGVAKR